MTQIDDDIDRLANVGVFLQEGNKYSLSDKFKQTMAMYCGIYQMDMDNALTMAVFDFFEILSEDEAIRYVNIINCMKA